MDEEKCRVDLHIHTTASDGALDNDEVLNGIEKARIQIFSITDHDTIENGIKVVGHILPYNAIYILGAEISCTYRDREYHITAYGFDHTNRQLAALLEDNRRKREEFNISVVKYTEKLLKKGLVEDYIAYKHDKRRGGWKNICYMMDRNIVDGFEQFVEIIVKSGEKIVFEPPKRVIDIIKGAGGHAFMAHPAAYIKGDILNEDILEEWRDMGISGIECYSPYLHDIRNAGYYLSFCRRNNLMISGGSDFHGGFVGRELGVPEITLSDLKLDFINGC